MTVGSRLTWALSLLTLLTLGAAFAVTAVVLDREQVQQLDETLLEVAHAEAEEAPANGLAFTSRPGPAANDVGPLEKHGVIFDARDRITNLTPPFDTSIVDVVSPDTPPERPFDFAFGGRPYRGVVVAIPGYAGHRVLVAASRDDLDRDWRFVRKAMLIALGVSTVWLTIMIAWLVRRHMREHARIAEILHRIAGGDTSLPAPAGVVVEATELRQVGTDIDVITRRLGQVIELRRRFIAHAAHELRSPLTALRGGLQQALRKDRSAEEYRESLSFLLRASDRLMHLADELLELARAEQAPVASEIVDFEATLEEVVESLRPLTAEKRVTIVRAPGAHAVVGGRRDLERILRNLLDNALRHAPEGSEVRIDVEQSDVVRVSIHDEGEGVQPNERERIFQPFHRSGAARQDARGAGLGLAIARELARRHGGDVAVGETRGTFVLTLTPAADASPRADTF